MIEWIVAFLLVSGSLFMLIASIGVVKLSDVYMRMHAITKAASLGVILMLGAVVVWYISFVVVLMAAILILSVVFTSPIAAHLISRTAHAMKVPKGNNYVIDEYQDMKDKLKSEELRTKN